MRKLNYKLLLSEFPYAIASGAIHYDDVRGHECLPIKVTIPDGYEHIVDIHGDTLSMEHGDRNPWFSEHYREILLGLNPDWYLFWIEVNAGAVIFNFYCKESGESVAMILNSDCTNGRELKFHFDIPHQNGKPDSGYDVRLMSAQREHDNLDTMYYEAIVTEYFVDGYRELIFTADNQSDCDDRYVLVTEYVDE